MRIGFSVVVAGAVLLHGMTVAASGPLGIIGIVEKVVFEPDEAHAERLQVWGAFAYVDGGSREALGISKPGRGYLYFNLPGAADQATVVRREWADLKSVAGTGQAVGFGRWRYPGVFSGLDPSARGALSGIVEPRVRAASETAEAPATYGTDSGVVKVSADGNRADLVRQLREALKK